VTSRLAFTTPGWLVGVILLVAVADRVDAQFLGAWLPPERSISGEIGIAYLNNQQWFCGDFNQGGAEACEPGEKGLISDTGTNSVFHEESRSLSTTFKAELTPWKHLSFKAELPFHKVRYESDGIFAFPVIEDSGIGDLRLILRGGGLSGQWAYSGGYGLVLPTGEFTLNAFVLPIGQGTRNHDFFAELGRSLWPAPGYLQGGALYRIREPYEDEFGIEVDWGNEVSAYLQGGWNFTGPWWAKLETKVFKSERWKTTLEPVEGDFRSAWDLTPAVFLKKWNAFFELWVRVPLAGRATPADPAIGFKVFYRYAQDRETAPSDVTNP